MIHGTGNAVTSANSQAEMLAKKGVRTLNLCKRTDRGANSFFMLLDDDSTQIANWISLREDTVSSLNTRFVMVDAQGSDLDRATAVIAAYATAKTMSPTATHRVSVVIPPGWYDFTKLRATQLAPAFTLDTDYIDLTSLTGNPWSTILVSFPTNATRSGPTIQQTATDIRITGLWIAGGQTLAGTGNSYMNRGFEQVGKLISTGNTGTQGDVEWAANAAWLFSDQSALLNNRFTSVLVGDYVTLTGTPTPKTFKIVSLNPTFDGVQLDITDTPPSLTTAATQRVYAQTLGTAPVGPTQNVGWTIVRTASKSIYTDCIFYAIGDDGSLNGAIVQTGQTFTASPWGVYNLDGTWRNCLGSDYSWRVNTYGSLLGTFKKCEAGIMSFGGDGNPDGSPGVDNTHFIWLSALFEDCVAGDFSYGSCTEFGSPSTGLAELRNCRGGHNAVCVGREFAGKIKGGRFGLNAIAGYNGNSGDADASAGLLGKLTGWVDGAQIEGGDCLGQGWGLTGTAVQNTFASIDPTLARITNTQWMGTNAYVHTTGNTLTVLEGITVGKGVTYYVEALVSANGSGISATFRKSWNVQVSGTTVTVTAGGVTEQNRAAGLTTADISLVAVSPPGLQLKVTGEAATAIDWNVLDLKVRVA